MTFQHADLRRKIIEDVLGESIEEYESFSKEEAAKCENKRQHRQRIPLWRFLLHLLNRDKTREYIEWSCEKPLEFRIRNTTGVAELWGSVKNKSDMTYEKLGRAMRYYYGKNVIEKVSGRRYSYRFILSRRTKKYLAQFADISKIQPDKNLMENSDDYDEDDDDKGDSSGEGCDSSPPTPKDNFTEKIPTPYSSTNSEETEKIKTERLFQEQTIGKTKIFRPNELMFQSLNNFTKPNERKLSAFSVPEKHHYLERQYFLPDQITYSSTIKLEERKFTSPGQKRHLSDSNLPYQSNSKSERIMHFTNSEVPSIYRVYSTVCNRSNDDDYILRRETRQSELERHEQSVLKLHRQLSLNYKVDSFIVGCSSHKQDLYKSVA